MLRECESCRERRDDGEMIEVTGRVYYICADCCRKTVSMWDSDML